MQTKQQKLTPQAFSDAFGTSLRDVLNTLFRHKSKMILCFFVIASSVIAFVCLQAEIYQSTAKVLIKRGREALSPELPVMSSSPGAFSNVPTREMARSELAILQSREVAEQVVDKIGVERIAGQSGKSGTALHGRLPKDKDTLRQRAVENTMRRLDVKVTDNVIELAFEATDPYVAHEALASLLDIYKDRRIAIHVNKDYLDFLEGQTSKAYSKLTDKESEIHRFEAKFNVAHASAQRDNFLGQLNGLLTGLTEVRTGTAASEARVASLEKVLQGRLESVEPSSLVSQDARLDAIKTQLIPLKMEEAGLVTTLRFPEKSKRLQTVRRQIQVIEGALAPKSAADTSGLQGIDDITNGLETQLESERIELEAFKAQEAALTEELREVRDKLDNLGKHAVHLASLQRERDVLDKTYLQFREKSNQAILSAALDHDKLSTVSVIQIPTMPFEPIRPRKRRNIALGIFLGLVGSLGLAFVLEYLDDSLKTNEDIEKRLGLPVLATVPLDEFKKCI